MSSQTPNLKLNMYDTTTDGEVFFNVDTHLNQNWDIIDQQVSENAQAAATAQSTANEAQQAANNSIPSSQIGQPSGIASLDSSGKLQQSQVPSATDTIIGNRTADPSQTPTGLVGTVTQWFSWITNRIKAITGKSNWYDAPSTTLEAANTHINATTASIHGSSTSATANTIAHRDASGNLMANVMFSSAVQGLAPLSVISTTKVPKLNADQVDGFDAGNVSGNIPVSNGTVNANLNADLLDGYHGSASATANTYILRDANGRAQVADPSAAADIATKNYVDSVAQGLDAKASVRVATTANITLSGTQTIDGIALSAGDRVLVKDQTTASQNGIYTVQSGTWTRATDADTSAKVTPGMYTWVEDGTTNADSGWSLITNGAITIGTTNLTFTQFSGAGQITAGAGLSKTGNTISMSDNGTTDTKIGNRTVDQTTGTAYSNTGTLTQILSWFAKVLAGITGKTNWYDAPAITLQQASDQIGDLSTLNTTDKSNLVNATVEVKSQINTHSGRTDNPHGTTASQVGAVAKTGDTMTGGLTFNRTLGTNNSLVDFQQGFVVYSDNVRYDGTSGSRLWLDAATTNSNNDIIIGPRAGGKTNGRTIFRPSIFEVHSANDTQIFAVDTVNNTVKTNGNNLAQILSGGYKIHGGTAVTGNTANAQGIYSATVTFPSSFSSVISAVLVSGTIITNTNLGANYTNLSLGGVTICTTHPGETVSWSVIGV